MDRLIEFVTHHPLLVGAFVGLLGMLLATAFRGARGGSVTTARGVELLNREEAVPVDLRGEAAFRAGHIIQALRLDPARFEAEVKKLERLRERPLLVYCETGASSGKTVARLKAAGFPKVFELHGGIAAWRADNLPLEN